MKERVGEVGVVPVREITTRHVVVIVAFLVTLGGIVLAGRDSAAFIVVGLAVLGGLGVVVSQQASNNKETAMVREQTNGSQTRMMDMVAEQARQAQATNDRLVAIVETQGALLAKLAAGPERRVTDGAPTLDRVPGIG